MTERISKALALGIQAHEKQARKSMPNPHVFHPMGGALIPLDFGVDEDQLITLPVHDVLEDFVPLHGSVIEKNLGKQVFAIVDGCADGMPDALGQKGNLEERKHAYLTHLADVSDDVLLGYSSENLHKAGAIASDLLKIDPEVFSWRKFPIAAIGGEQL